MKRIYVLLLIAAAMGLCSCDGSSDDGRIWLVSTIEFRNDNAAGKLGNPYARITIHYAEDNETIAGYTYETWMDEGYNSYRAEYLHEGGKLIRRGYDPTEDPDLWLDEYRVPDSGSERVVVFTEWDYGDRDDASVSRITCRFDAEGHMTYQNIDSDDDDSDIAYDFRWSGGNMAGTHRVFGNGVDEPIIENVAMKYDDKPLNMNVDLNSLWPVTAYMMFATDYALGFYGRRNANLVRSEYFIGNDDYEVETFFKYKKDMRGRITSASARWQNDAGEEYGIIAKIKYK